MKKLNLIIREIRNFFYLQKIIRRESLDKSPETKWNSLKLRKNWYGRIYTVVSLREQDMGEEEIVQRWKAMEMMRPINDYLFSLDLHEIIFPSIEQIPNTRSFLIVYSPIMNNFSWAWILSRLVLISATVYGIYFTIHKIF